MYTIFQLRLLRKLFSLIEERDSLKTGRTLADDYLKEISKNYDLEKRLAGWCGEGKQKAKKLNTTMEELKEMGLVEFSESEYNFVKLTPKGEKIGENITKAITVSVLRRVAIPLFSCFFSALFSYLFKIL